MLNFLLLIRVVENNELIFFLLMFLLHGASTMLEKAVKEKMRISECLLRLSPFESLILQGLLDVNKCRTIVDAFIRKNELLLRNI